MCATDNPQQPILILASSSPRRRELLGLLGLPFVVQPTDVEEVNYGGESPAQMAIRLSQAKAQAALPQAQAGLIVAADTLVALDDQVVGKPADAAEAVSMLRALRARSHIVFSAVTVIEIASGQMRTALAQSTVWMRDYSDAEIAAYVASGDPLDKAGAYAIQHPGFDPVSHIAGCYANVMGLPLCHLYRLLHEMGVAPAQTPVAACDRANQRRCDVAWEILPARKPRRSETRFLTENGFLVAGFLVTDTHRNYGSQSMVQPLRRVLVKRPDPAFAVDDPAAWHYTGRPDLELACREHDALVAILRQAGAEVIYHDEFQPNHADAIFVHDPAIVTERGAIILRMGKALRRGEEEAMSRRLQALGVPIHYTLHGEALAEGGDLLWIDHDTLAVGLGFRTNPEGLRQLQEALQELGVKVIPVQLPYFQGAECCLHLMSLISLVDHDLAVVYLPLLPVPFWQYLVKRGFRFVEVPDAEFPSMGPNVLALAPRQCVMLEGNPITKQRLEEAGCQVFTYQGDEISLKAEGGPTCLTRPILRGM